MKLLLHYYSSSLLLLLFLVVVINLQAGLSFLFQLNQISHRNLPSHGTVCLHAGRQVKSCVYRLLYILYINRAISFF
jgi:hypothetical protein